MHADHWAPSQYAQHGGLAASQTTAMQEQQETNLIMQLEGMTTKSLKHQLSLMEINQRKKEERALEAAGGGWSAQAPPIDSPPEQKDTQS